MPAQIKAVLQPPAPAGHLANSTTVRANSQCTLRRGPQNTWRQRTCCIPPLQEYHDGQVVHPGSQHHSSMPQLVTVARNVELAREPALRDAARVRGGTQLWQQPAVKGRSTDVRL